MAKQLRFLLDRYINEQGLNNRIVAQACEVHESFISRLRSGDRELSYQTTRKLADVFSLTGPARKEFFEAAGLTDVVHLEQFHSNPILTQLYHTLESPLLPDESKDMLAGELRFIAQLYALRLETIRSLR